MSLIGAIFIIASAFASSFVTDIRLYILTISIMSSIGDALVNAAVYAIIPHYFDKKLGFATGIMNSGSSVVTVVSPFLAAYLLKGSGLRRYFQISALFYILLLPGSWLFRPKLRKAKYDSTVKQLRESFQISILKNSKFIVFIISTAFWEYGSVMFYQTIVRNFETYTS